MKESEFIELLNLYLDQEISPADAVRLEHEVQTNARRRTVYHDYCRLHKACRMLSADFRPETTGEKVVAFEAFPARRRRRMGPYFAASLLAAAAGIAVVTVFVGKSRMTTELPVPFSEPLAEKAVPARAFAEGADQMATARVEPRGLIAGSQGQGQTNQTRLLLGAESLVLSGNKDSEAVFSASMQQADDQLAWIRNFQLVSLKERTQLDQLRFESPPASLRPDHRQLMGRTPTDATMEMTAFRINK